MKALQPITIVILALGMSAQASAQNLSEGTQHQIPKAVPVELPKICRGYDSLVKDAAPEIVAVYSMQCYRSIPAENRAAIRIKELWSEILDEDWGSIDFSDVNIATDLAAILKAEGHFLSIPRNPPLKSLLKSLDNALIAKKVNFHTDEPKGAFKALVSTTSCGHSEAYYEYLSAVIAESFEAQPEAIFARFVEYEERRNPKDRCPEDSYIMSFNSLMEGAWGDGYVTKDETVKRQQVMDKFLPRLPVLKAALKKREDLSEEKRDSLAREISEIEKDWLMYLPVRKK